MEHLTAVILAGGLGTRLRSAVPDRQKVIAQVGGRPFLSYLLDQVASAGAREAVLCTGYLGEQVREQLGDSYRGLRLAYSQEPSPLGTGGALRLVSALVKSPELLVLNGDSFFGLDLAAFRAWHDARRAAATIALVEVADAGRYGCVDVGPDGAVARFQEKGSRPGQAWINAGVYLLARRLLSEVPRDREVSLERELFPAWIGQGVYGYQAGGKFLDIGDPDAYAAAESFFAVPAMASRQGAA